MQTTQRRHLLVTYLVCDVKCSLKTNISVDVTIPSACLGTDLVSYGET